MIGYVEVELEEGGPGRLILGDDGRWSADPPLEGLPQLLDLTHDPRDAEYAEALLPFGVPALGAVAREWNGNVHLAKPLKPLPEGVVS